MGAIAAMTTAYEILPNDRHNAALLAHVHPAGWRNPTPAGRYNLVVIGGGTAGLVSAAIAAALGARVALVERHGLGGDCLITGCVPSKAVLRSARAAVEARGAAALGGGGDPVRPDFGAVMERMRRLRAEISPNDSAERFAGLGVDVYLGTARFVDQHTVDVDGVCLKFKKAILAMGTRAQLPEIEGMDAPCVLTNASVFTLTELPADFVVIGGGPIGCELAQAFQRLGSRVTLIERGPCLLPREDAEAAALLRRVLEREGVRVMTGAEVMRVAMEEGRGVIHVRSASGEEAIPADKVLVGTGRTPNVDGMNLEAAGVTFDLRTGVAVNDMLQTANRHIFAAGDVCSRFKFTHTADYAARIAVQNALFPFLPKKRFSDLVIPWCTYTEPEIAHVGVTEQELVARGGHFETVVVPFEDVDRAILDGATDGFFKVHLDPKGRILGATLAGAHAGDLISEVTLAMTAKLSLGAIGNTIHPYPTSADILRKAADAFNRKRLTPQRKRLLTWIFARMR